MMTETSETTTTAKVTSADIRRAIRAAYTSGYSVFDEVANDTGTRARRWIDCVVMGIWPSTGYEINGIEIKVSRSDFLREIKAPEKTQELFRFCDRFWLACPAGMVAADEVPINWGIMVYQPNGSMKTLKKAPPLEPQPVTRGFMAAVVRRAGAVDAATIAAAVAKAQEDARKTLKDDVERAVKSRLLHEVRRETAAQAELDRLKKAAGLDSEHWLDVEHLGKVIGAVYRSGALSSYHGFANMAADLRRVAGKLDEAVAALSGTDTKDAGAA